MFRGSRERHRQLMAELRALEAQDAGIEAARVVTPPKDKLSLGKALMLLGGLGAVGYVFIFSDSSPLNLLTGNPEKRGAPKEGAESTKILNEIKYGQMDAAGDGLPQRGSNDVLHRLGLSTGEKK